jgi:hypothetical protein
MKKRLLLVVLVAAGVAAFYFGLGRQGFSPLTSQSGRSVENDGQPGNAAVGAKCATKMLPPKFVVRSEPYTDPSKLQYDQVRLMDEGVKASDIFAAEPRNEAWAAPLEKEMGGWLKGMLQDRFPNLKDFSFECRSRSCRLMHKTTSNAEHQAARDAVEDYNPAAAMSYQSHPGNVEEAYLFWTPPKRADQITSDAVIAKLQKHRAAVDAYRQRQAPSF